MAWFRFLGNTHVRHEKHTAAMPAVRPRTDADGAPIPKEVVLPMTQHIGAPATPTVKVGDTVKVGQCIGEASGYVSAPIYASVSGKVKKIEPLLLSNGRAVSAVRIENDGLYTPDDTLTPPTITDFDSLRAAVQACGLVGLGGAGFPTAVKLDAEKKGLLKTIVVNGAECEPYITSDTRTMIDRSRDVYEGILLLLTHLSVEDCVIGIEENKPEAIAEMRRVFADEGRVSVKVLPDKYPQGGEKVLIYNTVGRTVPEGGLPADVGVLVINVTTAAELGRFARDGMPLTEKTVTVDGSAVREPKNITVPIGTPIADVIEMAGGLSCEAGKVLYGGPMMGVAVYDLTNPVTKTTNGLTVLSRADAKHTAPLDCIHCGRCVAHCPMHLMPTRLESYAALPEEADRMARLEDAKLMLCIECGCCSYVCPSHRPLVQSHRLAKADLRDYKAHHASLKK